MEMKSEQRTGENKKKLVLGILAHVDAGKTTLAEAMLYLGGQIRKLGRVDHGDAFLDNFALERERGITIFSKQAKLQWKDVELTLLDTPGHVDFSAEMERTLQVLDYAVLVINGVDGVQAHTRTLWRLLERYEIPTFLFINKMDQQGTDGAALLESLRKQLDENCVAFTGTEYGADGQDAEKRMRTDGQEVEKQGKDGRESGEQVSSGEDSGDHCIAVRSREALWEDVATCGESLMEAYLEQGKLSDEEIGEAIVERRIFPCYFGAALRVEGVGGLLDGIAMYGLQPMYPEEFGARVYKISRDRSGVRLTHLKITGGTLRVKMSLEAHAENNGEAQAREKVDQIRVYNGAGYETAAESAAGEICAVTGLTESFAGQGLGIEELSELPILEPVLTYRVRLPEGTDAVKVLGQFRQLEEEEPLLHIVWREESREIHAQVMGEVQIEVLKKLIGERFGIEVEFEEGSILYKETIGSSAIGIGHYEPLRHYAEVELLLEPGERGSGLQFASLCSEDTLDRNWQRLILTHLEEKVHVGVLTGSPITDMRILLVAGRAHLKHTEGGDFRQATYRAVRQGLRSCESILLEPMFSFALELPTEYLGRGMSDIQRMYGKFDPPVTEGERSILNGRAPVAAMRDYQREVNAYTHGNGHLSCILDGYEPCHNAEEVLERIGYDPEGDLQNPTGSVFCAHGAGFVVNWDQVPEYAHVEVPENIRRLAEEGSYGGAENTQDGTGAGIAAGRRDGGGTGGAGAADRYITQEEIEAIFRQTYGGHEQDNRRRRRYHVSRRDPYGKNAGRSHGGDAGGSGAYGGAGDRDSGDGRERRNAKRTAKGQKEDCLLVDGYNIIFAWEELRSLAKVNIDSARDRLMDIMSNYQGILGGTVILVFDAYKVKGNPGSVLKYHNIYVVYTKEAETADQYIEKTVHEMADKYQVTVATSDALEQMIIWGAGALRMSAIGLKEAVEQAEKELREEYTEKDSKIAFRPFL